MATKEFTCLNEPRSAVLRALTQGCKLNVLEKLPSTGENVKKLVEQSGAVLLDGADLSEDQLREHDMVKAAVELSVPIVMTNFKAPEMAAVAGVGLDAEVAVLQASDGGEEMHIAVLEDTDDFEADTGEGSDEEEIQAQTEPSLAGQLRIDRSEADVSPTAPEPEAPALIAAGMGPEAMAGHINNLITQQPFLRAKAAVQAKGAVPAIPKQSQLTRYLDFGITRWNPGKSGQAAFFNIDFQVRLYAANDPDNKFCVITTTGAGAAPGKLKHNGSYDRGFYQEIVDVEYGPTSLLPGFAIDRTAPANANRNNNLAVTTGFNVGLTGGVDTKGPSAGVSFGYSESKTATMSLPDFRVLNQTDGVKGRWSYRLSFVGQAYKNWKDLRKINADFVTAFDPKVWGLPDLAKLVLMPKSEAVWRAPGDFTGNVRFDFSVKQTVRRVWRSAFTVFTASYKTQSWWRSKPKALVINFGVVSAPK